MVMRVICLSGFENVMVFGTVMDSYECMGLFWWACLWWGVASVGLAVWVMECSCTVIDRVRKGRLCR